MFIWYSFLSFICFFFNYFFNLIIYFLFFENFRGIVSQLPSRRFSIASLKLVAPFVFPNLETLFQVMLGRSVQLVSRFSFQKEKVGLIHLLFVFVFMNYLVFRFVDVIRVVIVYTNLMLIVTSQNLCIKLQIISSLKPFCNLTCWV